MLFIEEPSEKQPPVFPINIVPIDTEHPGIGPFFGKTTFLVEGLGPLVVRPDQKIHFGHVMDARPSHRLFKQRLGDPMSPTFFQYRDGKLGRMLCPFPFSQRQGNIPHDPGTVERTERAGYVGVAFLNPQAFFLQRQPRSLFPERQIVGLSADSHHKIHHSPSIIDGGFPYHYFHNESFCRQYRTNTLAKKGGTGDNPRMQIIPSRSLNGLYIILDCIFLIMFCALLLWKKKRLTFLVGIFGGIIYFIVDYGIFYKALGTRHVEGMTVGPFLFWLSMSYGITNFAWIWLALEKDRHLADWSVLIICAWLCEALLSEQFGGEATIHIQRGTAYHGTMALLLFIGYLLVFIHNQLSSDPVSMLWLNAIGISVQFSWEAVLLVTGIRNPGFGPLVIDSLIETNLGLPYLYFIQKWILMRFNEDSLPRKD
mgnify:CR=1 FL=1